MKMLAMPLLFVGLMAAARGRADEPLPTRQTLDERLLGDWTLVSFQRDGQELAPHGLVWTICEDAITTRLQVSGGPPTKVAATPYRVHPNRDPSAIDLEPQYPPNRGKVVQGIYRLQGDTLTCCFEIIASSERPARFESAPGTNREVVQLQRLP